MIPSNERFPAVFDLAERHYREGNPQESKELLAAILKEHPLDPPIARLLALCHVRLGENAAAKAMITEALRLSSEDPLTWNIAGEIDRVSGDLPGAIERFSKAIFLNPSYIEALNNLGITYEALGRYGEARDTLIKASELQPGSALTWYNLGNSLFKAGRLDECRQAYTKALAITPNYPEALNNLGAALTRMERYDEAIEIFEALTLIKPDFYDGLYNFAEALKSRGEFDKAITVYQRAIQHSPLPKKAQTLARLAGAYRDGGKRLEALSVAKEAFTLDPTSTEALHARINLELDCGNFQTAKQLVIELINRDPKNLSARLCRTMLQMPTIYGTESDITEARQSYNRMLAELENEISSATSETAPAIEEIIGNNQPFFLPYQGLDCVELQRRYGVMISDVMSKAIPINPPKTRTIESGDKVRVGIVSGFFRNHSVYKMPVRGWLQTLDRSAFEIVCYHTQNRIDQYTREAANTCLKFVQGPRSTRQWVSEIRADAPDILIFPEIGMDPMSGKLAALRLAPIQATSWGHPVTSGIPTIDYFISSDAMEPPNGESHYTEKLMRLPGIGIHYSPVDSRAAPLSRKDLGIGDDDVFLWCCQSNYKYLPQFDWLFAELACKIPSSRFGFITLLPDSEASSVFRKRISESLQAQGLNADERVRFLPALSSDQFAAVASLADICLDSIEWSGCNSSMEVLTRGTPIVTYRGTFMRGRHTAAILEQIGCHELVAETLEGYVQTVINLVSDHERRQKISSKIRENLPRLYHDAASTRQLEKVMKAWMNEAQK
jgi:predicted O-linked N-acetylglucosamine transferase (SPINDLY family)